MQTKTVRRPEQAGLTSQQISCQSTDPFFTWRNIVSKWWMSGTFIYRTFGLPAKFGSFGSVRNCRVRRLSVRTGCSAAALGTHDTWAIPKMVLSCIRPQYNSVCLVYSFVISSTIAPMYTACHVRAEIYYYGVRHGDSQWSVKIQNWCVIFFRPGTVIGRKGPS